MWLERHGEGGKWGLIFKKILFWNIIDNTFRWLKITNKTLYIKSLPPTPDSHLNYFLYLLWCFILSILIHFYPDIPVPESSLVEPLSCWEIPETISSVFPSFKHKSACGEENWCCRKVGEEGKKFSSILNGIQIPNTEEEEENLCLTRELNINVSISKHWLLVPWS